jgi:hypothetical protein
MATISKQLSHKSDLENVFLNDGVRCSPDWILFTFRLRHRDNQGNLLVSERGIAEPDAECVLLWRASIGENLFSLVSDNDMKPYRIWCDTAGSLYSQSLEAIQDLKMHGQTDLIPFLKGIVTGLEASLKGPLPVV